MSKWSNFAQGFQQITQSIGNVSDTIKDFKAPDVLGSQSAIKTEVGIDPKTYAYLFGGVILLVLIIKKMK